VDCSRIILPQFKTTSGPLCSSAPAILLFPIIFQALQDIALLLLQLQAVRAYTAHLSLIFPLIALSAKGRG